MRSSVGSSGSDGLTSAMNVPCHSGEGEQYVGRKVQVAGSIYTGTVIGWSGGNYRVRIDRSKGADPALAGPRQVGHYAPARLELCWAELQGGT